MKLTQINEAAGVLFVALDAEGGEYLGTVGPFKTAAEGRKFLSNPKFDINVEPTSVFTPEAFAKTFEAD